MKTIFKYLLFVFLPITSFGQRVDQDAMEATELKMAIYSENVVLKNWNQPEYSEMNGIFIKQIGNSNSMNMGIVSENNNLNLNQYGNNNMLLVNVVTRSIAGNINQIGNNNYSFDFVHDPTQEVSLNLIQEGNNHHFERHGTNSIGNNLKFEMTGDSKTIVVRNFK